MVCKSYALMTPYEAGSLSPHCRGHMSNVIDLAQHRAHRARPPDDIRIESKDAILIELKPDGSYEVTISGAYAASIPTAVHHLADVIVRLAPTFPH